MAVPATQDIKITRGDTETLSITLTSDGTTPINITGFTYRAQIRYTKDAASIALTFTTAVPLGTDGVVTLTASAGNTALLTTGIAYWDLEQTASGVVSTLLAGKCTVLADVSR